MTKLEYGVKVRTGCLKLGQGDRIQGRVSEVRAHYPTLWCLQEMKGAIKIWIACPNFGHPV